MIVSKCQRNEVQTLTLPYHHLNEANKNLTFWMEQKNFRANAGVLPFNKFELPHPEQDNCCSWKTPSNYNNYLTFE